MDNSPQSAYSYVNTGGSTTMVPSDTGPSSTQSWLFCMTGSDGLYNVPHMTEAANGNIVAAPNFTISPSDTLRVNSWGTPASPANSFTPTELISFNNSVRGMLIPGDVRANYILTGATWTAGNPPPNSVYGSTQMANTTLETYQQPTHCFDCHNGTPMLGTMSGGLSHIYGTLGPLSLP